MLGDEETEQVDYYVKLSEKVLDLTIEKKLKARVEQDEDGKPVRVHECPQHGILMRESGEEAPTLEALEDVVNHFESH